MSDEATDQELIVLVDPAGIPIGAAEKLAAHHADTPLHLAFSCYVFDRQGRFLATQRASSKKVWPDVWTNSACGHPAPGETVVEAIQRHLRYELGMTATEIEVVLPTYSYRAPPFRGIVENEFCPVYVARSLDRPEPNPVEVRAYAWKSWSEFVLEALADTGERYSWWCKDQLSHMRDHPLLARYSHAAGTQG